MKKFGQFCMGIVPMLLAIGIQLTLMLFMTLLGLGLCTALLPTSSVAFQVYDKLIMDNDFQTAVMLGYGIISVGVFGSWYYARCGGEFRLEEGVSLHPFKFLGLIIMLPGLQFLASFVCGIVEILSPHAMEVYIEMIEESGLDSNLTLILFLYSVIIAPICEELIFRGVTFQIYKRIFRSFWLCNILQALLFGIFHMNLVQGCYAFTLGIVLGYICKTCGSIYFSIFTHMLFNLWGTVLSDHLGFLDESTIFEYLLLPITAFSIYFGILLIRKFSRKKAS